MLLCNPDVHSFHDTTPNPMSDHCELTSDRLDAVIVSPKFICSLSRLQTLDLDVIEITYGSRPSAGERAFEPVSMTISV